jgi:hypothetical protein
MRLTESDVLLMARRGKLNWRTVGSEVRIQPAVLSGPGADAGSTSE